MTTQQLQALSCDQVGNVVDWDNSYWNIPSSLAQTDTALSCSESPPTRAFLKLPKAASGHIWVLLLRSATGWHELTAVVC